MPCMLISFRVSFPGNPGMAHNSKCWDLGAGSHTTWMAVGTPSVVPGHRYLWAKGIHVIVKAFAGSGLPWWLSNKESACSAAASGNTGSIPGSERSPGKGNSNPLQYSCLENPMDRGTWRATVHRVTKNQTWLKWLSTYAHTYHWKERY